MPGTGSTAEKPVCSRFSWIFGERFLDLEHLSISAKSLPLGLSRKALGNSCSIHNAQDPYAVMHLLRLENLPRRFLAGLQQAVTDRQHTAILNSSLRLENESSLRPIEILPRLPT